MDSYEALAASYDELTEDVEYEKRADFVEKLFLRAKRPVRSPRLHGHGRRLFARDACAGAAEACRT